MPAKRYLKATTNIFRTRQIAESFKSTESLFMISYMDRSKGMRSSKWPSVSWTISRIVFLVFVGISVALVFSRLWKRRGESDDEPKSAWVVRMQDRFLMVLKGPETNQGRLSNPKREMDPRDSPYLLPPNSNKSGTVYTEKKPPGNVKNKTISYYDPKGILSALGRTKFGACEYSKCEMTDDLSNADLVIFLSAKFTDEPIPTFKRKHRQLWLLKTDEAPSRFFWFRTLNRTGMRDRINLTLTHKLDSDIHFAYGKLMEKGYTEPKDYDAIYERKSKMAAWFVSHCPVTSERKRYVELMRQRLDVDIFGECGNLSCGYGKRIPGLMTLRPAADQTTCFPMLSKEYMFYLAFENSLCQEYITEKFFKMFSNADVVPVVRGGANYKSYFPSDMFVDAGDFDNPFELADFLDDLAKDKERYISYLKSKDRYVLLPEFPDWQCRLCEKLHVDKGEHWYKDIHHWLIKDSCHDPRDSVDFI